MNSKTKTILSASIFKGCSIILREWKAFVLELAWYIMLLKPQNCGEQLTLQHF